MTEITRVPLQPIARGSLGKLWLGIAAAVLAAGGVAWASLPPQVRVETIKPGEGPSPTREDYVLINYKGTLPDGKVFDQAQRAPLNLAQVVPGFAKALERMQKGGTYKATIPAELGYGDKGAGAIPPNTDLTFQVELLDFKSAAEIQAQMQMMQQMQMQQQGGVPQGGVPGGASPEEGTASPEGGPAPR
ncbi:MAG: FKBP-type peptidyl-prolyl cis-trans isomerase [Novosphingobium sp.]|nr:FKBP-type peptidyl-prolyl cis-trans isomerase [Novosphingobium sp.]